MILIFDEIVTGFGRLGSWFAAEQADVWPDILCRRQGADERVRAALGRAADGEGRPTRSGARPPTGLQYQAGHTFASNPVSAACGLAVIRYFEEHGVLENVRARGAELEGRLREMQGATRSSVRSAGVGFSTASTSSSRVRARRFRPISRSAPRCSRRRGREGCSSAPRPTTRLSRPRSSSRRPTSPRSPTSSRRALREVNEQVVSGGGIKLDVAFGL